MHLAFPTALAKSKLGTAAVKIRAGALQCCFIPWRLENNNDKGDFGDNAGRGVDLAPQESAPVIRKSLQLFREM